MKRLLAGLRCVELGVTDLQLCADFYERIWSLRTVARTSDAVYLRGQSGLHHILVLRQAKAAAIHRLVFDATDAAALHELHARISAGGYPVSDRPRRLEAPGEGVGFDSRDPEGRNFSFACEVADHATSTGLVPDRVTKITHLNLNSGAYEGMRTYMVDVLGFRVVDETRVNGFFNCNNDHHSIVIGRRQAPTLNHVAFEMPDLDSTMRMAGTMSEAGYPIEWGVGRHGPGNNVFAYFAGPEDMPIECTSEVLQIDDTYRYRGPEQWSFPAGRTDQWGVTGPPSARIKRIQNMFRFPELPLR
jgi:catechol 2,3-dioxygenase-like lactoylglutathione lyase family enzyme